MLVWGPKGFWGASGGSPLHFGQNILKQKLHKTLNLMGPYFIFGPQTWIQKYLGPLYL